MDVLRAWMRRGTIYDKCARQSHPIERAPAGALDEDEIESMAGMVVAIALRHFRDDVLSKDVWDPDKGASLTTFFVGQCLMRFPEVWRPWLTSARRRIAAIKSSARTFDDAPMKAVDEDVLLSMASDAALALVRNKDARIAFAMTSLSLDGSR